MSVILSRHLTLEEIQLEPFVSVDGQGLPAYSSPVDVDARAIRRTDFIQMTDGSRIQTELTVWVPGTAATLPSEKDRITFEGTTYIVAQIKDVKARDATLEHRRARCRRE